MGITNFNRGSKIDWGFKTEGLEFKKLSEIEVEKVYTLKGCFITPDNGYGLGAVLIIEDALINIPQRYVDDVKGIMADEETVDDIKAGKCGFKYTTFISEKHKRTGYSVEFVEL